MARGTREKTRTAGNRGVWYCKALVVMRESSSGYDLVMGFIFVVLNLIRLSYINGLTLLPGSTLIPPSIHLTWTYRSYVPVTLEDSRQQAGPNGPENNHDLYYAWSPFEVDVGDSMGGPGKRWFDGRGELVGIAGPSVIDVKADRLRPVLPTCSGILAWRTSPGNKGITNQESQAVDGEGGVHVLNREEVDGVERWWVSVVREEAGSGRKADLGYPGFDNRIYYTLPSATVGDRVWQRHLLPHPQYSPTSVFHPRGKMFCTPHHVVPSLYIFLPRKDDLVLIRRGLDRVSQWDGQWEEVLSLPGAKMMEVLIDASGGRGGGG